MSPRSHAAARRSGRLRSALALLGLLAALGALLPGAAAAQTENLLDRITNEKMRSFEDALTRNLNGAVSRYISPKQYVLRVTVVWNRDVIPAVQPPGLGADRQKLPGFPIFVRSPDSPPVDEGTPPFIRMVVKVLLDETLPEYYERFVRKIVPVVARFDEGRGDQVVVLKEAFPQVQAEEAPPTLPERELMQQVERPQPLTQAPGQAYAQPPPGQAPPGPAPSTPSPQLSAKQAAQIAYDEGRYTDALRIVQAAFQRAYSNKERGDLLAMEGSVYFTMDNTKAAREAWRRALVFDPTNLEVHKALNYLEQQQGEGAK